MKNAYLLAFAAILFAGCRKVDVPTPVGPQANAELKIASTVGIKLQSPFVTTEVARKVKSDVSQVVTIKILDIANRVVSKETVNVVAGDNILKVYTSALPSSAYRIALYDVNGKQLGVTDFNKL